MPFKRYQIQPVWRADRPQKGRFREFYQCDVDTVGSTSPVADAECLAVLHDCLAALGFQEFRIRINHRALLSAMVSHVGAAEFETVVLVALDKLGKIGWDKVSEEMSGRGVAEDSVRQLRELLTGASLDSLGPALGEAGAAPIALLREVMDHAVALGVDANVLSFDPVLARGLGYYTGPIFEAEVTEPKVGSIAGGGRYDGLIGMFSKNDVPAVGISLGLERILAVLEEWGKLPGQRGASQVLVTVFSPELQSESLAVVRALREAGVAAEMTLDAGDKLGRQFKRAHALGIPWVLVMGPSEIEQGLVQLKHLESGDQESLTLAEAIGKIRA
jgi:histidyl-tRNA synthetase